MPNIELLEKSMPVAPIRIAALAGCRELAEEVDKKLVKFRKELVAAKKSTIIPQWSFSSRIAMIELNGSPVASAPIFCRIVSAPYCCIARMAVGTFETDSIPNT